MGIDVQPVGKKKRGPTEVPKEHRFLIRDLNNQVMAILSEDKSHLEEDAQVTTGKLNIEGRVSFNKTRYREDGWLMLKQPHIPGSQAGRVSTTKLACIHEDEDQSDREGQPAEENCATNGSRGG